MEGKLFGGVEAQQERLAFWGFIEPAVIDEPRGSAARRHHDKGLIAIEPCSQQILKLPERRKDRFRGRVVDCWDFSPQATHGHRHSHAKITSQRNKLPLVPLRRNCGFLGAFRPVPRQEHMR